MHLGEGYFNASAAIVNTFSVRCVSDSVEGQTKSSRDVLVSLTLFYRVREHC